MIKNFAKFSATMGKGFKVGESDVEIKLTLPLKVVQDNFMFLSTNQGEKINVFLGDPQAAFEFEEDERDAMYRTWNGGRRVTTDASGVVTRIEGQGEEKDENQAELFNGEGSSPDQQEADGDSAEQTESTTQEQMEGEGSETPGQKPAEDHVTDQDDPYGDNDDNEMPDWMKEGGGDQSGPKEMDFTSEGDQQPPAAENPLTDDKEIVTTEIDKEQLEKFILAQRPIFEDIKLADAPADFPALLQQRNEGKTWMEISKEINVPSGQISSKYGVYKKRVTKMMQDGVAV
ncbi:hypothetical protein PAECIP112173_02346 [Paenibacillus sp. JJ-100]|uniref:hypothetical protein n=1 Tax=Paenibacillus sp. JJ-100 TaxID=2974896 RepID=UPI0022FFC34C|nr:hypothetical protein [Paenibacillus sp. JJ-100]CAI6074825.1 hypothetical protein PAECIP112173_02346 [Paenibacillus sp. JJ-100]